MSRTTFSILCAIALLAGCGGGDKDASNMLPSVNAGFDQTVEAGAGVNLAGSANDDDGRVVSYRWSQFSGTPVTLVNPEFATASFIAPLSGATEALLFRLDVTDDKGGVASDGLYVNITGPNVSVDSAKSIAPIRATQLGINGDPFTPTTGSVMVDALRSLKSRIVRWPGGFADAYHWETGRHCQFGETADSFDDFVVGVAKPIGAEMMINVNYGSNAECNGPADPAEAVRWVAYANKQKKYGIRYWSIGNELYFQSSYDLHSQPRDPKTYAAAVANDFYPRMKAVDPSIKIGVVVGGNQTGNPDWDRIVLAEAKYDFVEMHNYPVDAGEEDDDVLLGPAVNEFSAGFAKVRAELQSAGRPNVPIFLAEFNSVSSNPGKQSLSIVNALFTGMAYAEALKASIDMIAPHFGPSDICFLGNTSATLYGWQNYGTYSAFSTGAPTYISPGPGECTVPAAGTVFPFGRALQLIGAFATPGEDLLETTVRDQPNVRAYAATRGAGYTMLLFNLDKSKAVTVSVGVGNGNGDTLAASLLTYDKAIYDKSAGGEWLPPSSKPLGNFNTRIDVTLTPWSMNVLTLQ